MSNENEVNPIPAELLKDRARDKAHIEELQRQKEREQAEKIKQKKDMDAEVLRKCREGKAETVGVE